MTTRRTLPSWTSATSNPPTHPPDPAHPGPIGGSAADIDKLLLLRLGYRGYLSDREHLNDLRRAVETVHRGEVWAERSIMSALITAPKRAPSLTMRESQVLSLITQGCSNKQIAQRLGIAEKTVKVYVSGVLEKSGLKTRMDLVMQHQQGKSFVA